MISKPESPSDSRTNVASRTPSLNQDAGMILAAIEILVRAKGRCFSSIPPKIPRLGQEIITSTKLSSPSAPMIDLLGNSL